MTKYLIPLIFFASAALAQPSRIITLSPALTELIYTLHFEKLLIGVSDFSDYPADAKNLPSVGAYTQPNFEKILELKPDLIFVPLEGPEDVKHHLEQLHLHFEVISMRKLKEIGEAAEKISQILGRPQIGQDFRINWNKNLKELFSQKSEKLKSVFIEVQKDPLIAAGTETFLDEIVKGCGGTNIVEEKGYPHLNLEFTASRDIDLILLADYFQNSKEEEGTIKWWQKKKHPPRKVMVLDSDTTARPGPRLLKGIKSICAIIKDEK